MLVVKVLRGDLRRFRGVSLLAMGLTLLGLMLSSLLLFITG